MYGPRGGRGLALRAGRATFSDALKNFGALAGVADLAFVVLPLHAKLRIGLPAFAKIFVQLTDQMTSVEEKDNEFIWTIHRCPCCWGRHGADKPVCYIATGLAARVAQMGLRRKRISGERIQVRGGGR